VADLSSLSNAELRAIATRNLVECCAECRALLRHQLIEEEFGGDRESRFE
jgi:hypothetical protein